MSVPKRRHLSLVGTAPSDAVMERDPTPRWVVRVGVQMPVGVELLRSVGAAVERIMEGYPTQFVEGDGFIGAMCATRHCSRSEADAHRWEVGARFLTVVGMTRNDLVADSVTPFPPSAPLS
jgi:hypothetical protein